jgi:hypothetical protein
MTLFFLFDETVPVPRLVKGFYFNLSDSIVPLDPELDLINEMSTKEDKPGL